VVTVEVMWLMLVVMVL